MRRNLKALGAVGAGILIAGVLAVGTILAANAQCHARWYESGLPTRFSPLTGCMVRVRPDVYVPEDIIKEVL